MQKKWVLTWGGVFFIANSIASAAQLELLSNQVLLQNNEISAPKAVLLGQNGFFATAASAKYDQQSSTLQLDENVFISHKNQLSLAKSAQINAANNTAVFKDFFTTNSFLELWLAAKKAEYAAQKFLVKGAIVSSCNSQNPEWQINFSSGEFDSQSKDLQLKNMVFRYRNVPIFWLPYFRINTDERRKSGLLTPKFAFRSKEGIYAQLPYFYAINHAQDIELRPQLRSARGAGLFARYRLADSPSSRLTLDAGYFKEQSGYAAAEQLKYDEHFGLALRYERDRLFTKNPAHQEGLFIDYLRVNDVDFLNLSSFASNSDDFLITSKFNYFYSDNQDFYAAYARIYQDTTKPSQATTVQEFPSFQYRRFFGRFGALDYKIDAFANNYFSRENGSFSSFNFALPISFKKHFLNGLNLELKQQAKLIATSKKLAGSSIFHELQSTATLRANLFKRYAGFSHFIDAAASLGYNSAKTLPINEFFQSDELHKGALASVRIDQFARAQQLRLRHSFVQTFKSFKPQTSSSDLQLEYQNFSFKNSLKFERATAGAPSSARAYFDAGLKLGEHKLSAGFYYNKRTDLTPELQPLITYERQLFAALNARLNEANSIYVKGFYDLAGGKFNDYAIGLVHRRRCINYTIEFKQKARAKLTQNGIKSVRDKGVYLRFNLYPIGGVRYNFALGDEDDL